VTGNTSYTGVFRIVGDFVNELTGAMPRAVVRAGTTLATFSLIAIKAIAYASLTVTQTFA